MNKDPNPDHPATTSAAALSVIGHNPPWRAKSVWIGALLALLGAVLWMKDSVQTPAGRSSGSGSARTDFAGSTSGADYNNASHASAKPKPPATFRLGVSYIAGFFLGWGLRRFLKATLLLSGAIIALIALGRKLGWVDLDWASIEGHVRSSLSWLTGEAGTIKHFFTGYLPSAGAAGVGVFFGFRRK